MPTTTPQPTNFHNVKIGDILIDQDRNERKVLGKTKQGLLLSSDDDFTLTDFGISFSELEELNYQLKLEEIKPKVEPRWQKPFDEFTAYLEANHEQRFWQALRNVSKADFINHNGQDTFFWETLTK